jgi:CheY-like chemotaxis protein/anti-sigma regulatory factor (Ser/Thr protein kinase)
VNVATALAEIEKMMSPIAARAGVKLTVVQAPQVPDIHADDLRLRQVLANLVSNAIKYNRAGGTVAVSAKAVAGNRVRLLVADSGFGIAEEQHARLFDPFSRPEAEHANIEGIGLGLAISRRLAEAMGGSIGFKSARGKGSTFWVELPVDAAAPVQWVGRIDTAIKAVAPIATAGNYSILYIDDNHANLRLMEQIISTLRAVALLVARTPQLGLDLAVAHRPDVIVLDVNLPGISGYELVTRLKALPETCHIPVLALSAAASIHSPQRDVAAGFFRYLTKPIDVKAFLCAVDQALMAPKVRRAGNGG